MLGVFLKKGRDKAIISHHPWIFSGAVEKVSDHTAGDILPVYNSEKVLLGSAYINTHSSIFGRMVCFDATDPLVAIKENILGAISYRKGLFDPKKTSGYRLINSEGDNIPGLIVDKYGDYLVIQVGTLGIEKIKDFIISVLKEALSPIGIYEKSNLATRRDEGLEAFEGVLYGEVPDEVLITENSLNFYVDLKNGQKTGFFFDQREMRNLIRSLSKERRVLNCFSYTGGFSCYAADGGARVVDSIDISQGAIDLCKKNLKNNHFHPKGQAIVGDVFEFLRKDPLDYNLVILDPPAFAKKKKDIVMACRGYKDINRLAMTKMPKGSYLLTCSCSYHVDEKLFQQVIFQAAAEAKRDIRIVGKHVLAQDHPLNIYHPEGDYLKSLLLYIS